MRRRLRSPLQLYGIVLPVITAAALGSAAYADDAAVKFTAGATTYQANCLVCHGKGGVGLPGLAPPLTGNPARYIGTPEGRQQLAMTVLHGMFGDITVGQQHFNFKMPDFAKLSDDALAEVLNYVVFDLAHAQGDAMPMSAGDLAAERSQTVTGDAVRQHRAVVLAALGSG